MMIVPKRAVFRGFTLVCKPGFNGTEEVRAILFNKRLLSGVNSSSVFCVSCVTEFLVGFIAMGTVFPSSNSTVRCQGLTAYMGFSLKSQPSMSGGANSSGKKNVTSSSLLPKFTRSFTVPEIGRDLFFQSRIGGLMPTVFITFSDQLGS